MYCSPRVFSQKWKPNQTEKNGAILVTDCYFLTCGFWQVKATLLIPSIDPNFIFCPSLHPQQSLKIYEMAELCYRFTLVVSPDTESLCERVKAVRCELKLKELLQERQL